MIVACALVGSYLIGSLPTAYLLVWRLKRIDVRTVGSGNVGATNVSRVAGFMAGLVVFCIDLAKGALAVWWLAPWFALTPAMRLSCGLAAILGHNFPVWLGFRGGKGVATTIGVLVAAMPPVAAAVIGVWGLVFLIWRYVSLASLAAALAIPLAQALAGQGLAERLVGALLAGLIVVRHHANIRRLVQGTELRAGRRSKAP